MPTQPIEVNIQSTGITQEDHFFFHTKGAELPSEEQLWQRKQEKRNALHTEPLLITMLHCYINNDWANTLLPKVGPINKIPTNSNKKSRNCANIISKTNARITF